MFKLIIFYIGFGSSITAVAQGGYLNL